MFPTASIVDSLVNDLIMPVVGKLTGGVDFSDLAYPLQAEVVDANDKVTTPEVLLRYGAFINTVVDFLIVAFAIFVAVKIINTARARLEGQPSAAPPPENILLLREIRDSLAKR